MKRITFNAIIYFIITLAYPIIMARAFATAFGDFWRTLRLELRIEHAGYLDAMSIDPWEQVQKKRRP